MTKASNETSVYEIPNDQTSGGTVDVPDTDGSGETNPDGDALTNDGGEGYDVRSEDSALIKIVNGWDVNADVTLKGSTFEDATMDEDADDQTAKTINAGENDYISETEPWAYLRVVVSPAADPTSGTLKIVYQSDRGGKS